MADDPETTPAADEQETTPAADEPADEQESTPAVDEQEAPAPGEETERPNEEWGEDISPDKDGKVYKKIIEEGSGDDRPGQGDEVAVHYTGRLLDGTVFDSSVERDELFKFELGEGKVIKGWDVGVATMRRGEKCLLTCTPEYAYGANGSPPKIPGNSTLQFEVELFSWSGKDITDDGGVLMSVIHKPNKYSPKPTDGAKVLVSLKGTVGDHVFDEREVEFPLGEGSEFGIVEGIEKAISKMNEKQEVSLVVQPKYAYGEEGDESKGVPPNTEVKYWVMLKEIFKTKQLWQYDSVEERIEEATQLKEKAGGYFKQGKHALALKVYKRAAEIVSKNQINKTEEQEQSKEIRVLLHLNMAACLLKLSRADEAIKECDLVLEEDDSSVKAFFRRGQGMVATQEYKEAESSFQAVLRLEPGNKAAHSQIRHCRQLLKAQMDKEKKLYAKMFSKMGQLDDDEPEPAAPVKDAISKAMEHSQEEDAASAEEVKENGITEDSPQRMEVEAT